MPEPGSPPRRIGAQRRSHAKPNAGRAGRVKAAAAEGGGRPAASLDAARSTGDPMPTLTPNTVARNDGYGFLASRSSVMNVR